MSPKPFPFPINVGTDICSVPRIFSILTKRGKAEPFLRQILSVQERNQLTHEKVIEPTRLYFKAIDRAKGLRKKKRETAGNVDFPTIIWELSRRNTIKEDVPVAERRQENYLEIEGSETTSSKLDHESSASIELATHTIGKVHQEPQDGDHIELAAVPVDSGPVAETDSINKTVTDKEEAIAPETRSDLEDASGKVDIAQVEGNDAVTADNGQAQQQKDQEERPWSLNAAKQEITRTRDLIQRGARFLAGRYAAKEAAKKAYRHRDLTWHDIWIQSGQSVNGRSKAPQALIISENGSWEDGEIVPMNISHDSDYATAVCLSHEPGSYVVAGDTSPNAESGNNSRIDTSETVDTEKSQSVWAQERDKTLRMQELSERLRSVKPYGIYDPRARAMEDWLKGKIIWNGAPRQAAMELDAAMKKQKREEEERKAPRQVAMDLEVTKKKKRREDEIFRKLMYSEDRMEQNEEDPRFIRRIYTIPNPQQAERAKRTIFVGNIHPETTIDDLQATFAQYSASVKAYLYANTEGELLGTGAIVLETGDEAATACQEKDQSDLHGNVIRCLPWFSRAFRRFLQRGVGTDAVFLRQRQDVEDRERALLETETETLQDTVPKPLLESEPLPQPSSPQYILVRELFRIQDEYHNRRSRGIFVTGLNTDATEDDLRQHFAKISENATVTLRRRKDGRSLGTAYVTFETPEEATEAREKMDGTLLLGGVISCQVGSGKEDLGKWTKAIARDLDKF